MISKVTIEADIRALESLFSSTSDQFQQRCYAKLALLEFSGWIEVSIDEIIKQYCMRQTKDVKILKDCDGIISRTHGFKYKHFKQLLINAVGMVNVLLLEKRVKRTLNTSQFLKFRSTLEAIGTERDKYAHTHLSIVQSPNAPSYILNQWLDEIFVGLRAFERSIRRSIG